MCMDFSAAEKDSGVKLSMLLRLLYRMSCSHFDEFWLAGSHGGDITSEMYAATNWMQAAAPGEARWGFGIGCRGSIGQSELGAAALLKAACMDLRLASLLTALISSFFALLYLSLRLQVLIFWLFLLQHWMAVIRLHVLLWNYALTHAQVDRVWKTSISCRWRTRATQCITANVLQTKVDAHCDKLGTELSWQRLRVTAIYLLSKVDNFNLPHLHLAPSLGWSWQPNTNYGNYY